MYPSGKEPPTKHFLKALFVNLEGDWMHLQSIIFKADQSDLSCPLSNVATARGGGISRTSLPSCDAKPVGSKVEISFLPSKAFSLVFSSSFNVNTMPLIFDKTTATLVNLSSSSKACSHFLYLLLRLLPGL